MKINILLWGQLKSLAEADSLELDVSEPYTIKNAVDTLVQANPALKPMLVDENSQPQPSIVVFAEGVQVISREETPLAEGMELTLMSPISGG
jgi:molybdopterin converting factor small subunit